MFFTTEPGSDFEKAQRLDGSLARRSQHQAQAKSDLYNELGPFSSSCHFRTNFRLWSSNGKADRPVKAAKTITTPQEARKKSLTSCFIFTVSSIRLCTLRMPVCWLLREISEPVQLRSPDEGVKGRSVSSYKVRHNVRIIAIQTDNLFAVRGYPADSIKYLIEFLSHHKGTVSTRCNFLRNE